MVQMVGTLEHRLLDGLMEAGVIDASAMQTVLTKLTKSEGNLMEALRNLGIPQTTLKDALQQLGIEAADLSTALPIGLAKIIPEDVAKQLIAIPIGISGGELRVAMEDVTNANSLRELEAITNLRIIPIYAPASNIRELLAKAYASQQEGENTIRRFLVDRGLTTAEQLEEIEKSYYEEKSLLIKLVKCGKFYERLLFSDLANRFGLRFKTAIEGSVNPAFTREEVRVLGAMPIDTEWAPSNLEGENPVVIWNPLAAQDLALVFPYSNFILTTYSEWQQLWEANYLSSGNKNTPQSLGETFVKREIFTHDELRQHLAGAAQKGLSLARHLLNERIVSEETIGETLAYYLRLRYIDPIKQPPNPNVKGLLGMEYITNYQVLPWERGEDGRPVILLSNPEDARVVARIQAAVGDFVPAVATASNIKRAIAQTYSNRQHIEDLLASLQSSIAADVAENVDGPAVKLVNSIIEEAIAEKASDIHVEAPERGMFRIRHRVDGELITKSTNQAEAHSPVVQRIKVMAGMNLSERRIPQDNQIRFSYQNGTYKLRVSTMPGEYGEKVVIRILQGSTQQPRLDDRGFASETLARFRAAIRRPHGLILITGPTGSGKTNTIFGALAEISGDNKNTMTVEDPVEIELEGVHQVQVNEQAGLTFAKALRSFLRQDPDILMVGEIRDAQTAQIATQAAMTGHLVISTLHTNDAPKAVGRLRDLQVENFNIADTLIGVLAQRLVRRVCRFCAEKHHDPAGLEAVYEQFPALKDVPVNLQKGKGCNECGHTGYAGRIGIFEWMEVDEGIRHSIAVGASNTEIKQKAIAGGMHTLREDGLIKAFAGITTLEEVFAKTEEDR